MTTRGRPWSRDERLVVLSFYLRTRFSSIDARHPEVIAISKKLDRSPSSIAMRALNFASLDPTLRASGRTGLEGGAGKAEREMWNEMESDWTAFENANTEAAARLDVPRPAIPIDLPLPPDVPTEQSAVVKVRRLQSFFRSTVLAAYGDTCAISGLAVAELLNASHIIPWSQDEKRRADPTNGVALNALYDRAFDRGLISFDERFRVLVSSSLKREGAPGFHRIALIEIEGRRAHPPSRFEPDPIALEYHRDTVFVK